MAEIDAYAYGSLGALAPDFDKGAEPLEAEQSLELFMEWVQARGLELWDHQEEALLSLAMGNHVILGTPTGSGKSLVAIGMCFMALCEDFTAYYTAPIKALVSEKFFDLVEIFGRDNVGMITGDVALNSGAPIICCTAEILANQALREGEDTSVARVAMDEFHYFADPDRGWAWQVPLLALRNTKFLLMSATLGDVSHIEKSLEERTDTAVDCILDAERPVPLDFQYVETPLETTVELALRAGDAPIYIVHFAQDAALKSAQALASYGVSTREQRDLIKEACKGTRFSTAFGKTLQRLLLMGVGVHHAGMLPRYRLLVEKLAQQGLLPVICGTDTLGVGINVPIHTVLLTALAKFDGKRTRRLNAREFHQIAGRAGRAGYDTEGVVIAEATVYDQEKAKALAKAGGDPKKARKIRTPKPPEGFVGWNKTTFDRLIEAVPEPLRPRMKISHSMVLAEVSQGGDARERVRELIGASLQTDEEKEALLIRSDEIFATLMDAGVVVAEEVEEGVFDYYTTVDVPDDFALDQPLSPFLLAAIELIDPESDTYALDVISLVEATLEDPYQILRAQEKQARAEAIAQMKADGVDYDERMDLIQEVTYPKPLEDLIFAAFGTYCEKVPWANDYTPRPKTILRDMLECADDFKGYVQRRNISRAEGILLRYLSEAYRSLDKTLPFDARDERLSDIISWLGLVVRSVDSSLVDEWARSGEIAEPVGAFEDTDAVVKDRRAVTLLVRNALFARVRLAARRDAKELGELDADWGYRQVQWQQALDEYFEEHEEILTDADARSTAYFEVDDKDEREFHVWHVTQMFHDPEGYRDFGICADVELDATQEAGEVVFSNFRVGSFEELHGY